MCGGGIGLLLDPLAFLVMIGVAWPLAAFMMPLVAWAYKSERSLKYGVGLFGLLLAFMVTMAPPNGILGHFVSRASDLIALAGSVVIAVIGLLLIGLLGR
jgi:hypothetical protein